jgi:hypothetical protein
MDGGSLHTCGTVRTLPPGATRATTETGFPAWLSNLFRISEFAIVSVSRNALCPARGFFAGKSSKANRTNHFRRISKTAEHGFDG